MTFEVKNTGNEEAKELTFNLQTIFPINPVDANYYINSLMPGQSTNVTFYVDSDSSANPGTYPVTVYSEWIQPNGGLNQEFSDTNNYYLTIHSSSSQNLDNDYSYIIIVVIVIVAFVAVRKLRGKNSKGKHNPKSMVK